MAKEASCDLPEMVSCGAHGRRRSFPDFDVFACGDGRVKMPVKIFFSYSHKDEAFRDKLDVQLSTLKYEGLIETWHDRCITAGSPLDQRINARLEEADIILLLVSPDFLASQYCYGLEVTRALKRSESGNVRVIPVILRPCVIGITRRSKICLLHLVMAKRLQNGPTKTMYFRIL